MNPNAWPAHSLVAAWPWHMGSAMDGDNLNTWAKVGVPSQAQGSAWVLDDVLVELKHAEEEAQAGRVVLLGLAYEAAPAFDAAMPVCPPLPSGLAPGVFTEQAWPLLHWAAWDACHVQACTWADIAASAPPLPLEPWLDATPSPVYEQHFAQLQEAIARGEFYQLNLTTRLHSHALGPLDPWALFCQLWQRQPAPQALFWRTGHGDVLSLSPELFVRWDAPHVRVAPMKGTRQPSGVGQPLALAESAKDRAENVMIVDLLRNDLAKICQPRSVQVRSLFDVMHLPTVQQMTSSIVGTTQADVGLLQLLRALFPCGSITGAPKVQAMRRIAQWEPGPRGWYCGALGVLTNAGRRVHLNVPIRTLFLQNQAQENADHEEGFKNAGVHASYGVGSGCTWYSQADDERREWWLKTELLHAVAPPLQLFETVRLQQGQWVHGQDHLARLLASAQQLGFVCNPQVWQQDLAAFAMQWPQGVYRGRWVLSANGTLNISCGPMPSTPVSVALQVAGQPCVAQLAWLRHKTTHRPHYEAPLQGVAPGVFDALLYNSQGLLTETCRANVLLHLDGQWLTPQLSPQGLPGVKTDARPATANVGAHFLPGVYRALLLRHGAVRQAVLTLDHLHQAQAVAVVNSLRGFVAVHAVHTPQCTLHYPVLPAPKLNG